MAKTPRTRKPSPPERHTIADVYDAVLETKTFVLGVKQDVIVLREHVNERNEAIESHIKVLYTRIDGKLDNKELLTSLAFRVLNNRWARWTLGVAFAGILTTLTASHWFGDLSWLVQNLHSMP